MGLAPPLPSLPLPPLARFRTRIKLGYARLTARSIRVTFKDEKDGSEKTVHVPLGQSLLEAAHENEVELEGACEGSLACSTCHVIVEDQVGAETSRHGWDFGVGCENGGEIAPAQQPAVAPSRPMYAGPPHRSFTTSCQSLTTTRTTCLTWHLV